MKLLYAHNGVEVEANGEAAEVLIASGCFKPVETERHAQADAKSKTPRKTKTTKEQE